MPEGLDLPSGSKGRCWVDRHRSLDRSYPFGSHRHRVAFKSVGWAKIVMREMRAPRTLSHFKVNDRKRSPQSTLRRSSL